MGFHSFLFFAVFLSLLALACTVDILDSQPQQIQCVKVTETGDNGRLRESLAEICHLNIHTNNNVIHSNAEIFSFDFSQRLRSSPWLACGPALNQLKSHRNSYTSEIECNEIQILNRLNLQICASISERMSFV